MREALTIPELERMLGVRVDRQSIRALDAHGAGMIDADYLNQMKANMVAQREQAIGAIALIDHLLARLAETKPEPDNTKEGTENVEIS